MFKQVTSAVVYVFEWSCVIFHPKMQDYVIQKVSGKVPNELKLIMNKNLCTCILYESAI